ncbi:MAG TPA: DHA2 family efflux MFS transporter permease subunit [Anaeromyxobacteraceae bacterium]|nr:DHA2 family efflux MFS transporter permease subunit [Anaeromyxobacteraceae bacterium]
MPGPGAQSFRPAYNPWVIAFTVTIATFMEVLDTSIANVALPHIAGGLAASEDEATWVLTSYLVSNAVVLPISAWISGRIGRKRFYMSCVALFTLSSALCGIAPTLPWLILFRVLQGVGGGGLAPSEQAILADTFPPAQRGMAFAMYGLAVVLAPAIGPTLGGFIVDHASWRWIFYINVPVGFISLFLSSMVVEDPPWLKEERERMRQVRVDRLGLALVAVGFGSLQYVMDKGQEVDWFSSPTIVVFTMAAVIGLSGTVIWEWAHPEPVVNVRLFRNGNFAVSVGLMFTLGAVLYATTVLIPLFLQTLMGYSAEGAGEVMSLGGFVTMAMMPLAGFLVSRVAAKYLIAGAFAALSLALIHMSGLSLDIDAHTAAMYRVYQAFALAFLFIPINTVAYLGVPREQNNQVSGLMNLARNIGGSVGISFFSTMLARRSQTFQNLLVGHVTPSNPIAQERLARLARGFAASGPAEAHQRALAALYATVGRQAALLSYVKILQDLIVVCVLFVPLILLLVKRNDPAAAPAGAH